MEVARHAGRMRTPVKTGGTEGSHLKELAERGNAKAAAMLEGPAIPESLLPLWERFTELDAARGVNEVGLMGLTYQDVDAYARLHDWRPEPHEVKALMELDRAIRFPKEADA